MKLAESYLHALTWGLLANFITVALMELVIGLGKTRIVLFFSALNVLLNILFSFALIFGSFGLPALGVAGAGWGSTIGFWITGLFFRGMYLGINNSKASRIFFSHLFAHFIL